MPVLDQHFPIAAGVDIPAVGFGTFLIPDDVAADAVRTAIGLGYRHVDTAAVYANERGVGQGIARGLADAGLTRDEFFVTTKLWPGAAEWNEEPKTGEQTIAACEESLTKLGLGYVDLYLIHSPHGGARRVEQWEALIELKRRGLVRSVGVSNYGRAHIEEIRAAGLAMPDANQIELHPWSQKPELVAYLRENAVAPIAYSSLAPLSNWRDAQTNAKPDALRADTAVFADMAAKYGVSEAQLLLRWGVQNGYPVLPKSLNADRMNANIELAGFVIDDADMALLRSLDRGDGLAWATGEPTRVA